MLNFIFFLSKASSQIDSPSHRQYMEREDKYGQRSIGFSCSMKIGEEINDLVGEKYEERAG